MEVEASGMAQIEEVFPHRIAKGSSLYTSLRELGVESPVIFEIVNSARPIFDLGSLRPGTEFNIRKVQDQSGEIEGIRFRFSPTEVLDLSKNQIGEWVATKPEIPVEFKVITYHGKVATSLWESAIDAQMDPNLTAELAEIFAWQVDFSREVRVSDRWRLSVEQKWVQGRPVGWGRIVAAEYVNAGESYKAVLFRENDKDIGYFAPDGSSLKRMFLKSPIKFGRISSRFKRKRFHPILKVNRPHLGVDYAAPHGTPVRAVGDGTVTYAARRGGGGNTVILRHNSVYKTAYKHLSRYGRGVRQGGKVKQGQIIGYVGSTGLSTGPHLHFEFYKSGRFVDPLGQTFPSADPVPEEKLAQFKSQLPKTMASLPKWEDLNISMRQPASDQDEEKRGL